MAWPADFQRRRFKINGDRCFEYYGREKFRELYEITVKVKPYVYDQYVLHGTPGAGKSHTLATLACLSMRQGLWVVSVLAYQEKFLVY